MAVPDVCFTSNSANVYNCTCTSSLPTLPPKPDFSLTTTTTPTPTPTPTGNTSQTTTTSTMTPIGTGMTENSATPCGPNVTNCTVRISDPTSRASAGVIVGCTCGAIIFLVLCGFLIWWLWKKGKCSECGKCCICCIVPIDDGSQDSLCEEKQVELLKIEKKGTVILTPIPAPPAWPEQHGLQSTSPNPNRDITPVELSKEEKALPSQTTEGTPDSTTSRKKKKKKKGKKSNKVSPEPDPSPAPSTEGNETFANAPVLS